jgi:HEAT repeat protein
MMPSFLTVLPMPAPSWPRRGPFQGAWACAAMVMVWVSVLQPTLLATAHAAATAMGTTVGGARTKARGHTKMGVVNTRGHAAVASLGAGGAQRAMASRRAVLHKESALLTATSDSHHGMASVQEVTTTSPQGDAALEELLQTPLHVIQWHDAHDAVLLSAIAFLGHVGDQRAIHPLLEAWSKRTERQFEAIQQVVEKLHIKDKSDRNEALLVEQVMDQILDDINTALESLGIDRESLLRLNRDAVNKGSAKAIALLVKYGDTDSIPLLLALLQKGDNKVRNYNEALEKLGAEKEGIFKANLKALEGWNVQATLAILGTFGDRRAIGPIRRLLEMAEPVHTEAKAVLQQLGASWYDQRSDAERLGLWLGALIMGRALWRGCRMLWRPLRRSMPPQWG